MSHSEFLLASFLAERCLPVIATTTALSHKLVSPATDLSIHPISLVLAITLGLSTAIIASITPARRAAAQAAYRDPSR